MAASRTLSAFLAVLLCGLLFSTSQFSEQKSRNSVHVVDYQQEAEPVSIFIKREHRIALPFGHHTVAANRSSSKTQRTLIKRAPGLTFDQAKQKGRDFYTAYQCGGRPGTVFTDAQFENAWSDEEGEENTLASHWQTALGLTTAPNDLIALDAVQNVAPFINAAGSQATVSTGGFYQMQYVPSAGAIIALDTRSPDYAVSLRGVPKPARLAFIPELNRLSDVMWYTWDLISPNPKALRFICRDTVSNDASEGLIDEILERAGAPKAPWPGKTFGLDTDEGKALLGTPNGVAVGWLLLNRIEEMGRRVPTVTIWVQAGTEGRMMLWDLKPVP